MPGEIDLNNGLFARRPVLGLHLLDRLQHVTQPVIVADDLHLPADFGSDPVEAIEHGRLR